MKTLHIFQQISNRFQLSEILKTVAKGGSVAFVIQVMGAGIGFISQVLLARWMELAEYGFYTYAYAWAGLISSLSGLGLSRVVLRFIPLYIERKDWGLLRGFVARSRQLTFIVGVLFAIIGTLIILLQKPDNISKNALFFCMLLVPFLAFMGLQTEMIRGVKRILLAYALPLILLPTLTIGSAFLILKITGTITSVDIVCLSIAAMLVVIAAQSWSLRQFMPNEVIHSPPVFKTKEWLTVSFPLLLVTGFQVVLRRADILMVGMYIGQREAGIYNAASKTAFLVSFVLMAVNTIAATMISPFHAKGDVLALQRLVSVVIRLTFWPTLLLALGLIFCGRTILGLFGPEFIKGYWALVLLATGYLISVSFGPVGFLMSLTGHQNQISLVMGLSALVNICLNLVLIPKWGLFGAAFATMITMILWNVWLAILVKKYLGINSFVFANKVGNNG